MIPWKVVAIFGLVTTASVAAMASPTTISTSIAADQGRDLATLSSVEDWMESFIVDVAPPGRKVYYPEGQETEEEALARYRDIAKDVTQVVYDPNTKPLFRGPKGRSQTAAVVLSVMMHESSFMRHVDYGLGKYARGDSGQSWCLMQIMIGDGRTMPWNVAEDRPIKWNDRKEDIFNGYTGEELVRNRQLCIREGLKVLRISFSACRRLPLEDRLRSYASGSCDKGADASHNRMNTALQWFSKSYKGQFKDADVVAAVSRVHLGVLPLPTIPPKSEVKPYDPFSMDVL